MPAKCLSDAAAVYKRGTCTCCCLSIDTLCMVLRVRQNLGQQSCIQVGLLPMLDAAAWLDRTVLWVQGATFGFFHDILVTDNYYIALENPISMDFGKLLTKYMLGRACLAECLQFQDRPTRIHVIPRPGFQQTSSGEASSLTCFIINSCSKKTLFLAALLSPRDATPKPVLGVVLSSQGGGRGSQLLRRYTGE